MWNYQIEENILYEDNHIIVVIKTYNILSQSDNTNDLDMLTIIKNYIKEKYNKDIHLIYGGGVNLNNIEQLKLIKEIDGLILSRDALDIKNLDKIYKITNS